MKTEVHFKHIESKIINLLNNAQDCVEIAVAWITSPDILEAINNCLDRNVDIRIISVNDQINNIDSFESLYNAGAKIKLISKKLMHNKFCIFDRKVILSGSYNWTTKAANNHENITIVYGNFDLVSTFIEEYENIWKKGVEIKTLLPVNRNDIFDFEMEFENYLGNIKRENNLPYIFFLFEDFIANPKIVKPNYLGHTRSGFYLIKNESEEYDFFRYLFLKKTDYPFYTIRETVKIQEELKAFQILNVILPDELVKDRFILIKENLWIELFDDFGGIKYKYLAQISPKGDISAQKYRVMSSLKNSYIIQNNDLYQIFKTDSNFINFNYLNGQKPIFGIYVGGFLDERYFLCDVLIDNENKIKRHAIFNTDGLMVTDPIFTHLMKESPVLFMNEIGDVSTVLQGNGVRVSDAAIQKWNYDKNGKLVMVSKAEITNPQLKQTHTALYISDLDYGPLYFSLSIYKSDWEKKNFELAKNRYKSADNLNTKTFFEKMKIAREIVLEIQKLEKLSLDIQIFINKYSENKSRKNSDFCFIATAIYGDLNHPKTVDFRIFREKYLRKTVIGRNIILIYYIIAPYYVSIMKRSKFLTLVTRKFLFVIHSMFVKTLIQR